MMITFGDIKRTRGSKPTSFLALGTKADKKKERVVSEKVVFQHLAPFCCFHYFSFPPPLP
jgi:hypothetical protein